MSDSNSSSESFDPMVAKVNELKYYRIQKEIKDKEEEENKDQQNQKNKGGTKDPSKKACISSIKKNNQNQYQDNPSGWEQGQNRLNALTPVHKDEAPGAVIDSAKKKDVVKVEEQKIISKEEREKLLRLAEEDFE